jgi:lysylphosphatidylglycerol synthetase-like protein (DUF2156 family)
MREHYLDECGIIHQNCTYTAEAHHIMALSAKRKAFWLAVIPAVIAAATSALVAAKIAGEWLLTFTVISATVSAIAGVLNPNKAYQDHLVAARDFTAIKHDARFLRDSRATMMTDDVLAVSVEHLHQKYNELLKSAPPTEQKGFESARKIVQTGIHDPDRDSAGKIT